MTTLGATAELQTISAEIRGSLVRSDAIIARLRSTGDLELGRSAIEQRAAYEARRSLSRAAFMRFADNAVATLEEAGIDANDPLHALSLRFARALAREARLAA